VEAPARRPRTVQRLDRSEVERLVNSAYQDRSQEGLLIKTLVSLKVLFLTGTRVSEFVQIRVEDLFLDSDPPQIHITHPKGHADRYVLVLPTLAQELRTHIQNRRRG
jgi:integrase/recombinase XerD